MIPNYSIGPYNNHFPIRYISNNIIEYLVNNNEIIWKLLRYQEPDALLRQNLTRQEKIDLIYNGWEYRNGDLVLDDYNKKAVFRQPYIDDANYNQGTMLRIYLSSLLPQNKVVTIALYTFEVVCHNKSIPLISNLGELEGEKEIGTENRLELMVQQILETFNGKEIGSIGKLFFDMEGNYMTKGAIGVYNNRNYFGMKLIMGCAINGTEK